MLLKILKLWQIVTEVSFHRLAALCTHLTTAPRSKLTLGKGHKKNIKIINLVQQQQRNQTPEVFDNYFIENKTMQLQHKTNNKSTPYTPQKQPG